MNTIKIDARGYTSSDLMLELRDWLMESVADEIHDSDIWVRFEDELNRMMREHIKSQLRELANQIAKTEVEDE